MRKFDLSLRSSRSSYFATFRHQLTILSKTDALDEEKWLNMLGTFVKDWFRYESHFVHGRDSLVDILKERGLLSESDAVQPLDINNTIDHRPEGDEKWFLENEKTVTQFCRKLAAERPLKDIRDEYNYPKKKGIKDECSRLLEASTMKSRRGFAIQRLM